MATIALTLFGWCSGCSFRLEKKDFSCSFIKFVEGSYFIQFAYSISEYSYRGGVNHSFMYPLAVSLVMMYFFQEKKSLWVMFAVFMSLLGAALLSSGTGGEKW